MVNERSRTRAGLVAVLVTAAAFALAPASRSQEIASEATAIERTIRWFVVDQDGAPIDSGELVRAGVSNGIYAPITFTVTDAEGATEKTTSVLPRYSSYDGTLETSLSGPLHLAMRARHVTFEGRDKGNGKILRLRATSPLIHPDHAHVTFRSDTELSVVVAMPMGDDVRTRLIMSGERLAHEITAYFAPGEYSYHVGDRERLIANGRLTVTNAEPLTVDVRACAPTFLRGIVTPAPLAGQRVTVRVVNLVNPLPLFYNETLDENGAFELELLPGSYTLLVQQSTPDGLLVTTTDDVEVLEGKNTVTVAAKPVDKSVRVTMERPLSTSSARIFDSRGRVRAVDLINPTGDEWSVLLEPGKYTYRVFDRDGNPERTRTGAFTLDDEPVVITIGD